MADFIIDNRTVVQPANIKDIVVSGDSNSKRITFAIERYFDNIDLSSKDITINYINAKGKGGSTPAVIDVVEQNYFNFVWTIESPTLVESGNIVFSVKISSEDALNDKTYIWQTKPSTFHVEDSIIVTNDAVPLNYLKEIMFVNENDNFTTYDIKDDEPPIEVINRTIQSGILKDIVVSQDNISQILTFKMKRFFNDIDLSEKIITIKYINADKKGDRTSIINFSKTDTEITFGWLLDSKVAYKEGSVVFAIEILGYNEKNDFFVWQTKPAIFNVEKGLPIDDLAENPDPSWLQSLYAELSVRADNLTYSNNKLQLTARGVPIGSAITITGGGGPGGPVDAADVSYHNIEYPTIQEALDKLLYVPIVVTLSGGGTYEYGQTISTVNLNWTLNKNVISQNINNGIGNLNVSLREYLHSGQSITSNRTYTLTVNDGVENKTANTTVSFSHKRYWGVSASDSLTDAQIRALNSEFSTSRTQTRTFDATGGRYLYIAYPASWGTATFTLGGLSFSAMTLTTRNFVNSNGNTTSFHIYRSELIQTGSGMVLGVN